jgi:hypothetical protein
VAPPRTGHCTGFRRAVLARNVVDEVESRGIPAYIPRTPGLLSTERPSERAASPVGYTRLVKVVWISSYPRSGNTWVRFLLHAYLHGPIGASLDVARSIPNLHRPIEINPALQAARTDPDARLLIKTHGLPSPQHPLIDQTQAFIYIVRHPKDVLLSGINIHKRSGAQLDERDYARSFIKQGGDLLWNRFGFGFWESHADAWMGTASDSAAKRWPHVIVRYEDLITDATRPLDAMAQLLGEAPTPDRLAKAVRDASFERMRELEEADRAKPLGEGIFLKPAAKPALAMPTSPSTGDGKNFVNKGKSGQSLAHIDPALDALFDQRFGPALNKHGYA